MARRLTPRQRDVLMVVENNGPVTVNDAAYHLLMDYGTAYSVLSGLERRCLVAAIYTGHHRENGRRAYTITRAGSDDLAALDG